MKKPACTNPNGSTKGDAFTVINNEPEMIAIAVDGTVVGPTTLGNIPLTSGHSFGGDVDAQQHGQ